MHQIQVKIVCHLCQFNAGSSCMIVRISSLLELISFFEWIKILSLLVYRPVIRIHVRSECAKHTTPLAVSIGRDFTGNPSGYRIRCFPRDRQQRSRVEKEQGIQTAERRDLQCDTSHLSGTKGHWLQASRKSKEPLCLVT